MFDWNCSNCGKVDKIVIDGYDFSERVLEGIEVTIHADGRVEWPEDESGYMKTLNMEHWTKEALDCVKDMDVLPCHKCRDAEGIQVNLPPTKSISIKLSSAEDVLNTLGPRD